MNFQELMKRMAELDQPIQEADKGDMDHDGKDEPDSKEYMDNKDAAIKKAMGKEEKVDEEVVDECGMMGGMSSPMSAPKQQDSVTMNVSMNGSGAGGIRDLLNVLKDIQDGPSDNMPGDDMDMGPDMDTDAGPDVLLKKKIDGMGDMIDDAFANSAPGDDGEKMAKLPIMLKPGNDLHGEPENKTAHTAHPAMEKMKPGEKRTFDDNKIKITLENLYQEIKLREGSGPKEKQHSKYVDRNSAEYKKAAQEQRDRVAKDNAKKTK